MGKSKKEEAKATNAPSAPPLEEDAHQRAAEPSGYSAPTPNNQTPVSGSGPPPSYGTTSDYAPQVNNMGPQAASTQAFNSSASTDSNAAPMPPPPSYNEAVNCAAPPYLPYGMPKPQLPGPQQQYPIYPPPISGTGFVLQAPLEPQGTPHPHLIATTTTIIANGRNICTHCRLGEVHNETDLCCLLCLILFAIFTFPPGLILLCCIPCTVRRRCVRCRRLNQ